IDDDPAEPPVLHRRRRRLHLRAGHDRLSGNAASICFTSSGVRRSFDAPALSRTCATVAAFGIAHKESRRMRNCKATWRGVAPWAAAISARTLPPREDGEGKRPEPK